MTTTVKKPKTAISGSSITSKGSPSRKENGNEYEHNATAAYYRAEARGFIPGYEIEDWLEAESQLNRVH
ncbi:MAG TPA: DUF2934 domain-containing protein [Halothiobacillus sp.]|nr:DUF2934 domain-containing protein [Halothiobacillus sp.]